MIGPYVMINVHHQSSYEQMLCSIKRLGNKKSHPALVLREWLAAKKAGQH
jgi:hypothetical protein